ncbi:hypothetical protein [Micromonospora sp. NPDC005173]|uniref:hypothetical protein n=1 Tax=Micromonospora sp. NPDC005173 TaxID=3157165 RepID=UPI0033A5E03B
MPRERLSALAALPDNVIDPLLWRLALDVAAAHQPDERGNCRNLQCVGQRGMCAAARAARRAMTLARASRPSAARPEPRPAPERTSTAVVRVPFRGWFTTLSVQRVDAPRLRSPFERSPAATAA